MIEDLENKLKETEKKMVKKGQVWRSKEGEGFTVIAIASTLESDGDLVAVLESRPNKDKNILVSLTTLVEDYSIFPRTSIKLIDGTLISGLLKINYEEPEHLDILDLETGETLSIPKEKEVYTRTELY